MTPTLSNEEILRYSRHLILPEVGKSGQQKLKAARVLLVGCGGLGSPNALYLAAAGVGTLGLVDFDVVDASNLHRQLLYGSDAIGAPKVEAARQRILSVNPHVSVAIYNEMLTSRNALEIIRDYDLVIDGTDNFPTRYLVNDACVLLGKTNVYGSIFRFDGQATVFKPNEGPCYRCLFPEPPPPGEVPSCAEGGVLGILPGLVGMIQASEALKCFLGKGTSLVGRFLQISVLDMSFREIQIRRDPECPLCGRAPTIRELIDYEAFCGTPLGREHHDPELDDVEEITAEELQRLRASGAGNLNLIDVREPFECEISGIEGARLIPPRSLLDHVHELDSSADYIFFCRNGARSARAILQLQKMGFKKLKNLKGGLNALSALDAAIARY